MGEDEGGLKQQIARSRLDIAATVDAIANHSDLPARAAVRLDDGRPSLPSDVGEVSSQPRAALVPTVVGDASRAQAEDGRSVPRLSRVPPGLGVATAVAFVFGILVGNSLPRRL